MGGAETHRVSAVNLRAKFEIDFFGVDAGCWFPIVMEIAVFIHETRDFVFRSDRSPAVINTFARQREMETKICVGMRFSVVGNFREPRAGGHEAGGIDEARFQAPDRRGVYGMSYANVVGVDDQELGVARESQFFSERLLSILCGCAVNCYGKQEER